MKVISIAALIGIVGTLACATSATAQSESSCSTARRTVGEIVICNGKEYQYVKERGITRKVLIENRTAAEIEAERRDRDAYEDDRKARQRFDQEMYRYRGKYYSYRPNYYDRSSGSYSARIQTFGPCASKYASRYEACR